MTLKQPEETIVFQDRYGSEELFFDPPQSKLVAQEQTSQSLYFLKFPRKLKK
jgi:hypothetical protein